MKIVNQTPPKQEGKTLFNKAISALGFSLPGQSHLNASPSLPCQDCNDIRFLEKENLFLAAIADGVGSCKYSHWGAFITVKFALDSAEKSLIRCAGGKPFSLNTENSTQIGKILRQAFRDAQKAVEIFADQQNQMVYSFQSTLTLALYDGINLFFGHVGDDGIVVQTLNGNVQMLTARLKGAECNSVYPLQNGESYWTFGRCSEPVVSFIMATDGVLDSFVANKPDYYGCNYNNGIYYPFMQETIERLTKAKKQEMNQILKEEIARFHQEEYRSYVTDDLTYIAVVSNPTIQTAEPPRFSERIWTVINEESQKAINQALYKTHSEKKEAVASSNRDSGTEVSNNTPSLPTVQKFTASEKGRQKKNVRLQRKLTAAERKCRRFRRAYYKQKKLLKQSPVKKSQ